MEKIIIYLIIGAGYLVFNWYKKLNVPKEGQNSQPTPEPEKNRIPRGQNTSQNRPAKTQENKREKSIEEILKELSGEREPSRQERTYRKEEKAIVDTPRPKYESIEQGYEDIEAKNRVEEQRELIEKAEKIKKKRVKKSQYEIGQISDFEYDKKVRKRKRVQFDLKNAIRQQVILEPPKHFDK